MTIYSFISTVLSYVFTVIIYVFIIFVIRLIYLDVKKMSRFENNSIADEACAGLRPIKSKIEPRTPLKHRYTIYGEAVIGRSPECDIVINESYISQKHLIIWYENGDWYLEDLGSRNGTVINGKRIQREVILDPEDVISIGGLNFVFET